MLKCAQPSACSSDQKNANRKPYRPGQVADPLRRLMVYKKTERRPLRSVLLKAVSYLRIRLIKPIRPPMARSDMVAGSGIISGVVVLPMARTSELVNA